MTGKIEITSQNHGFCVDLDSLAGLDVELTHLNLNDGTSEGLRSEKLKAFAVQYHPELLRSPRLPLPLPGFPHFDGIAVKEVPRARSRGLAGT